MESAPDSRFPGCVITDRLHRPLHSVSGNPVDVFQRLLIVPERVPGDFVLHIGVTDFIKPLCPLLKIGTDLLSADWHPGIIPYDGKVLHTLRWRTIRATMLQTIGWATAGAVAGFLIGAVGASIAAAAMHMPGREGGPGYFALGIGILTAIAGFFAGVVYSAHVRGYGAARSMVWIVAVLGAIGLSLGFARWRYVNSQEYFIRRYSSVVLEFEVQPPLPAGGSVALLEDGSSPSPAEWSVPGTRGQARIFQVTKDRKLILQTVAGSEEIRLEVDRFPTSREWSDWSGGKEWSVRYRVVMP
jgi:hypothetical protein